jgi:hypothetical protein
VNKELIQKVIEEARGEEANLVIWDRRDTFTVEKDDVTGIELEDGYLRVGMQEGKASVYVELESIYKLVVEKERSGRRGGTRAGFGASSD